MKSSASATPCLGTRAMIREPKMASNSPQGMERTGMERTRTAEWKGHALALSRHNAGKTSGDTLYA